ncbi:MAG: alpha/beta hydrolase [Arcanobacterium sp.]
MRFHVFGDSNADVMILIHGTLTPWQSWRAQVDYFSQKYCVVAVSLSGHTGDIADEFESIDDEARQIEEYVLSRFGPRVHAVCGVSLGGSIAYRLFENGRLEIDYLILDGAPLVPLNWLITTFLKKQGLAIAHKSQRRDPKTLERFGSYFLPDKYLSYYLELVDGMSDASMLNLVNSVTSIQMNPSRTVVNPAEDGRGLLSETARPSEPTVPTEPVHPTEPAHPTAQTRPAVTGTQILFLCGTHFSESHSLNSAKTLKQHYPQLTLWFFQNASHAETVVHNPVRWNAVVEMFMDGKLSEIRENRTIRR